MARSRYSSSRDEERDPPRKRQNAPNMAPLFGFLVLAVVGIAFAGWVAGKKPKEDDTAQAAGPKERVDPFADLKEEAPPVRGGGSTRLKTTDRAPEGLENTGLWQSALKIAERGYGLAAEAELAKTNEDHDLFDLKGKEARLAFDEAIVATADWEMEIEERFGESDRQVRKIKRERTKWFDMIKKYRKAGSR